MGQTYNCCHPELNQDGQYNSGIRITQQPPPQMVVESQHEPDLEFAVKTQATFIFPTPIEDRMKTLRPFQYPNSFDTPRGKMFMHPYLLNNGSYYTGEWKQGKMHGKGTFVLPDQTLITCIIKDNVISGRGRVIYPNGDYYEGDIVNSKANGRGKCVEGDMTYEGEFKDNLQHGKGKQVGKGYNFQGQFDNGQKKNGTLTWSTADFTYEYTGQFVDNIFDGRGTLSTKQGQYVGTFKKGVKWGHGKFFYKNNHCYQGYFQNDKRHGQGKIIDLEKAKIVKKGVWRDDRLQQ